MNAAERIAEIAVLRQNAIDYWHCVDHCGGEGVAAMFTPDGKFHAGPGEPLVGHDAIEGFYGWRRERGERTSRHVITNFHADFTGDGTARTTCVMLLYASDGAPPFAGTGPAMITDLIDDCVKSPAGKWLYAQRDFRVLWQSGAAVTVAPDRLRVPAP
ncbi:MAG: nuclear transport factor 2 family protein [Croceibacterium sp.]